MVKIGQTLTIDGQEGKIDFEAKYNRRHYIGFMIDKKLNIYRVVKKNRKDTFVKEEDKPTIAYLLATWLAENINKLKELEKK